MVNISGLGLLGADAGNYTLSGVTSAVLADITGKALTVSGITADNKVYDRTTTATIHTGSDSLVGVISGDTVTADNSSASGAFVDRNVGVAKVVNISGLGLLGADAGNYTLSGVTSAVLADITGKALTVSGITADNKVYDRTTTATIHTGSDSLVGVIGGDTVSALITPRPLAPSSIRMSGSPKVVNISGLGLLGADAGNYTLSGVTSAVLADITGKSLTVSGITADNKVYDRTTTAAIHTGSDTLVGVIGAIRSGVDNSSASGAFVDKNVGVAKVVNISGLGLSALTPAITLYRA